MDTSKKRGEELKSPGLVCKKRGEELKSPGVKLMICNECSDRQVS